MSLAYASMFMSLSSSVTASKEKFSVCKAAVHESVSTL